MFWIHCGNRTWGKEARNRESRERQWHGGGLMKERAVVMGTNGQDFVMCLGMNGGRGSTEELVFQIDGNRKIN